MKNLRYTKLSAWVFLIIFCLAPQNLNSQSKDIDRINERMNLEIKKTIIEGKIPSVTVALVSGDKVVWTGSAGYSNVWAQTPAVPSTVYLIGSTFKTMSMYAFLQQMEQGKFKLDDRVNDYLEEFKIQGEDPANPVTFRHLLTHIRASRSLWSASCVGDNGSCLTEGLSFLFSQTSASAFD